MRIVITTFGSFGDVYPYIGLALGLKARGHEPVLAMPAYYQPTVEGEGITFHPVRPNLDPADRRTVARIMDAKRGTEYIVRELLLGSLRDTYADLTDAVRGADLLISHPITFAAPVVARRLRLPWISTVLAPMSFFSVHDLPVFPPMPWAKRLERVPGAARALVHLARSVTRSWGEPVYALRRELGLERGGDPVYEGQHSPTLVLALFSEVLASAQPDWPPSVRITGAIRYDPPSADRSLSPELQAFLDAGPPPVVFTLGTSAVGAAGGFYAESLEAVERTGQRAVLLVGSYAENRPAHATSDRVLVQAYAPHAALFPRASIIVHQGGAGTLHEGLRAGRPTLVVPFAHDQPDNAYRVARLGVSRTLTPAKYSAARVARELDLLRGAAYGERARSVAARVQKEDGVTAACDAIEEAVQASA